MNILLIIQYRIEVFFTKLLNLFSIKKNINVIPKGVYCYEYDKSHSNNNINICKYFRSTNTGKGTACTYVGYFGYDFSLYDQCKICGENLNY